MADDQPTAPRSPAVATATRRTRRPRRALVVLGVFVVAYGVLLGYNGWQLSGSSEPAGTSADLAQRLLVVPGIGLPLAGEVAIAAVMLALLIVCLALVPGALRVSPSSVVPASGSAPATSPGGPPNPPVAPATLARTSALPSLPSERASGPVAPASTASSSSLGRGEGQGVRSPRVFISHSSANNDFGLELVRRIQQELGAAGDAWYDKSGQPESDYQSGLLGGDSWWARIVREITERNVFVVLLSPEAMESHWVHDEIDLAWKQRNAKGQKRRKVIIPVLCSPCKVPETLSLVQVVSFLPGRPYEEALAELLAAIRLGDTRMVEQPSVESGPPFDLSLLPVPLHFVGRERELTALRTRLTARGSATGIVAVNGIGGIGKTGLAAKVVHDLRAEGRFADGVAVILCQGKTTPGDAAQILADVLTRFDPQRRAPEATDPAGLAEAAMRLLSGKDALVVLDNIEPGLPIEQVVAPLREAGATLLLTARQILPAEAVPPEGRLQLDLLSESEALDLLAKSLGAPAAMDLPHPKYAAVQRIVRSLGRHTLAVTLAGAYVADVGRDLERLAEELEDPQRALKLPKGDVPDAVKRVFLSSYEALTGEAQRLFVALAAFPTAEFGRNAALALAEHLKLAEPGASVDLLARRALAAAEGDERLRLHPLIQALAAAEFTAWPEEQQTSTLRAVAEYYAVYANATDAPAALARDEANITGALEWAHAHEDDALVAAICSGMQYFWRDTGRTRASLDYLPWGVAAAEALLGDPPRDGSPEGEVAAWRERADTLFWLLLNDGTAFQNTGKLDEAVRRYKRCLSLARQAQNRRDEGAALSVMGQIARDRGRLDEAEGYLKESLAIRREVQDRQGEGVVLSTLGQIAQARGRLDEAEDYYRRGRAALLEAQSFPNYARVTEALAMLLLEVIGNREEGCQLLNEAIRLYAQMGMPDENDARATVRRLGCAD